MASPISRDVECPHCGESRKAFGSSCFCSKCLKRWRIDWVRTSEEFWSFNATPKAKRAIEKIAERSEVDPRGLHILFNTQWNLDGKEASWIGFSDVPEEELAYARSVGVLREPAEYTHRKLIVDIVAERDRFDIETVASAFASSLTTRRLDHRSILGSYAHALHLSEHRYSGSKDETCKVCGEEKSRTVSFNHLMFRRLKWAGNVCQGNLDYVLADLTAFDASSVSCNKTDRKLVNSLFSAIRKLPKTAGLRDLEKSISGLFPSDKSERQVALEILGSCGILKPKDWPGRNERWVAPEEYVDPAHFYSKEWRRPVSSWTGADGINQEAVDFWFGT